MGNANIQILCLKLAMGINFFYIQKDDLTITVMGRAGPPTPRLDPQRKLKDLR